MGLLGCAGVPFTKDECNATLFPTAHEHELCLKAASDYQIKQDEKEDRRLIKRDALIDFLNACDAESNLILLETIRGGTLSRCLPSEREQRKAKREYGYPFTHDNVCRGGRKSDFKCWSRADFERNVGQL
jgi:hypothetical protein